MAATRPFDKLNDAIAREAFLLDAPPVCPRCNVTMSRAEVPTADSSALPAGSPPAGPVRPAWTCGNCRQRSFS